jgi:hypothetical protein
MVNIPTLISKALDQPVNRVSNLGNWLNEDMPKILAATKQNCKDMAWYELDMLAQKLHNHSLVDWEFGNTEDDKKFTQLFAKHRENYISGVTEIVQKIEYQHKKYEEVDLDLQFLEEELLPTLKELQSGEKPMRSHLVILHQACGNKQRNMPGLDFCTEGRKWIPKALRIDFDTSESIRKFLETLRDMVHATIPPRVTLAGREGGWQQSV